MKIGKYIVDDSWTYESTRDFCRWYKRAYGTTVLSKGLIPDYFDISLDLIGGSLWLLHFEYEVFKKEYISVCGKNPKFNWQALDDTKQPIEKANEAKHHVDYYLNKLSNLMAFI